MSTRIAFLLTSLLAATAAVGPALAQQFEISTYAGGAAPPTPVAAANAPIGYPTAVATDVFGNAYFISSLNCVFKVDLSGTLTRVAGNGRAGFSGDGGPAVNAQLFPVDDPEIASFGFPGGLAVDGLGNLYINDAGNRRIRKVSLGGIITTVAGNGKGGYSGDGGPATAAQLTSPTGLAVDGAGNLYIADGPRVRRVSPEGIITIATENGGWGVAVDNNGNLYLAGGYGVRKISPDGTIITVAGNGDGGDGGPATSAQLYGPTAVGFDKAGNLYIGDRSRVRIVSPDGIINTVAGGGKDDPGDGGPATSARIDILGIAVDVSGSLYVTDSLRIRKVSRNGVITTLAGNGSVLQYSGDRGPASNAQLNQPSGLALDAAGNLYVADAANARVRKISPDGIITTVAGNGAMGYSGDGGPATEAQITNPIGLAVDRTGNLYFGEGSSRVRKVSPDGTITTVAGSGVYGYSGDGGPATSAQLTVPSGIAVDTAGNLFILDIENNRVRKVSPDGIITTMAGTGVAGYSGDGGPATSAQLGITRQIHGINPTGLAIDGAGNLYIADDGNVCVRKVSPAGIITTVAGGKRTLGYAGDGGPATEAQMSFPLALAADIAGNLYIAEANHVRKVSMDGFITTIAGSVFGYSGDGGPAAGAQIGDPRGLAIDSRGNVYVADRYHSAVRLLQPLSSSLAVTGIFNAATHNTGPIAPGEIVVIAGSAFGPVQLTTGTPLSSGLYGTELAGTSVRFNGIPAPVIYTWATQVAAQVPVGVSLGSAQVSVTYEGRTSAAFPAQIALYAPGLFTLDMSGRGQAVAINQDGSINSASAPSQAGGVISLYATGVGQGDGALTITIGGRSTPVAATKVLAGVAQFDLKIPAGIQAGSAVPVVLAAPSASSQTGVTIAVR